MQYTSDSVDIPDELRNSLSSNELVVFVGAGVSARAYPNQSKKTYFPTFNQLVREIARSLGKSLTSEEEQLLKMGGADRVLGDWKSSEHQVHEIASGILSDADKKRIDVHRAIVRLFPKESVPRIVTTNFDSLLSQAIIAETGDANTWETYNAPLLPPAARFSGLCYLHGVTNDPENMILTDKDIGRAYMDEGWALKFAHDLFRNFNVLFIGYSLEDPPLRYLALALEGVSNKTHWAYVNCYQNNKSKLFTSWKRRGVEPIWYEAVRNDHRVLERVIESWAKENWFQFSDKKNTLIDIGKNQVSSLRPFEIDTAKRLFEDEDVLRDFASSNPDPSWFEVLLEEGLLDNVLLSKKKILSDTDIHLTDAIVSWIIKDIDIWSPKIDPYKHTLSPYLLEIFLRLLCDDPSITSKAIEIFFELFRHIIRCSDLSHYGFLLSRVMSALIKKGLVNQAVLLFDMYLKPKVRITRERNYQYDVMRSMGEDVAGVPDYKTKIELVNDFRLKEHSVNQVLEDVIKTNIDLVGVPILRSMTRTVEESNQRNNIGRDPDSINYSRLPAIEENVQNRYRDESLQLLIKVTRETWESLLQADYRNAARFREEWTSSKNLYLERLGVHTTRCIVEAGFVK